MSVETKWANIRRTIQVAVGDSVAYGALTVPIFHDYYSSDPDDLAGSGSRNPAWIETQFITALAGKRGDAMMQFDIFSQTGDHDGDGGDQFGFRVDGIADAVLDIFKGVHSSGVQKGKLFVKDFTGDINNPVETQMALLMQSTTGNIGEPQERRRLDFSQDFRRVTMRLRFRTIQDAAGNAAFYT